MIEGFHWLGIEKETAYVDIANKRIAQVIIDKRERDRQIEFDLTGD